MWTVYTFNELYKCVKYTYIKISKMYSLTQCLNFVKHKYTKITVYVLFYINYLIHNLAFFYVFMINNFNSKIK